MRSASERRAARNAFAPRPVRDRDRKSNHTPVGVGGERSIEGRCSARAYGAGGEAHGLALEAWRLVPVGMHLMRLDGRDDFPGDQRKQALTGHGRILTEANGGMGSEDQAIRPETREIPLRRFMLLFCCFSARAVPLRGTFLRCYIPRLLCRQPNAPRFPAHGRPSSRSNEGAHPDE